MGLWGIESWVRTYSAYAQLQKGGIHDFVFLFFWFCLLWKGKMCKYNWNQYIYLLIIAVVTLLSVVGHWVPIRGIWSCSQIVFCLGHSIVYDFGGSIVVIVMAVKSSRKGTGLILKVSVLIWVITTGIVLTTPLHHPTHHIHDTRPFTT